MGKGLNTAGKYLAAIICAAAVAVLTHFALPLGKPWDGMIPLLCLLFGLCRARRGDFRVWEL